MKIAFIAIFLLSIATINTHSTFYPGLNSGGRCAVTNDIAPTVYSWHVHIIFNHRDPVETAKALEFRQKVIKDLELEIECDSIFHNGRDCYFFIENENEEEMNQGIPGPYGPFIIGQFGLFFLSENYPIYFAYFSKNRGQYDIVFHPNTGCDISDHSDFTLWMGNTWPMNLALWYPEGHPNAANIPHESPAPKGSEYIDTQGRLLNRRSRTSSVVEKTKRVNKTIPAVVRKYFNLFGPSTKFQRSRN
jgi:aromatic ring-cleaving dioxygenase